jgi:hypothetical protein
MVTLTIASEKAAISAVDARPICLVCGSLTARSVQGLFDTRFGIAGRFAVQCCARCDLEQIWPLPEPDHLKHLYERFYNFSGERGTLYLSLRERFFPPCCTACGSASTATSLFTRAEAAGACSILAATKAGR